MHGLDVVAKVGGLKPLKRVHDGIRQGLGGGGVLLDKLIREEQAGSRHGAAKQLLRAYERATLYGETIEIINYSPEIDTYLKVICFPTFPGHCGCIMFDISKIKFIRNSPDAEKALMLYFGKMPE